jgi:hypothetical protein
MATVDFTLEDFSKIVGGLIAQSEERMSNKIESSIAASENRMTQKIEQRIIESEEKIIGAVKKSFDDYDKRLDRILKVQRQHSADITELKASLQA